MAGPSRDQKSYPRLGLLRLGPLRPILGDKISIGVIGTAETVEGFERWLERARTGIEGHSTKQPNLFPPFRAVVDRIEMTGDEPKFVGNARKFAFLAANADENRLSVS